MPRPKLPHLHRETARDKTFWYYRRGHGPRIRLRGEYGSHEFLAAYRDAAASPIAPKIHRGEGTFEWLWDKYRSSPVWANLSPMTRRHREHLMSSALKRAGNQPLERWTRQFIIASCDARASTPGTARNFLGALKGLFTWAVGRGHIDSNPAHGLSVELPTTDGFHTWTAEEMAAFESAWPMGTRQRLAYDVMLWTGLRRSDAIRVGHDHVKDGVISIETLKTKTLVTMRIAPPLAKSLEAAECNRGTFIFQKNGDPYTVESFADWFKQACIKAGVPGNPHGLRKALAVKLAEAGGTTLQIGAVLGNTMASLYARKADKVKLSDAAFERIFPSGKEEYQKPE